MDETTGTFRPPHMACATFSNFIPDLASRPLPPQIDRGMLRSKSGTDQNNLTAALTAFGLIGENQRVTPKLTALAVEDEDQRKVGIAALVQGVLPGRRRAVEAARHPPAAPGAVQGRVRARHRRYPPEGHHLFLHAARAAGLPISAHFPTTRSGSGSPGSPRPKKARASRKPSGNPAGAAGTTPPVEPAPGGSSVFSTEVKIKAGRVKLTVDVNPIELRGDERDFFYLLIDKMEEYAAARAFTGAAGARVVVGLGVLSHVRPTRPR